MLRLISIKLSEVRDLTLKSTTNFTFTFHSRQINLFLHHVKNKCKNKLCIQMNAARKVTRERFKLSISFLRFIFRPVAQSGARKRKKLIQ